MILLYGLKENRLVGGINLLCDGILIQMNEYGSYDRVDMIPTYSSDNPGIKVYEYSSATKCEDNRIYYFYTLNYFMDKREILPFIQWLQTKGYKDEWMIFNKSITLNLNAANDCLKNLVNEYFIYKNNLELFE